MHLQCDTVEDLTCSHSPAPGKIALIIGDILFLHGGIGTESYGIVPGKEGRCSSVKDWVDQLNAWKDQQLQDFCRNPLFYKDCNANRSDMYSTQIKGRTRGGSENVLPLCYIAQLFAQDRLVHFPHLTFFKILRGFWIRGVGGCKFTPPTQQLPWWRREAEPGLYLILFV